MSNGLLYIAGLIALALAALFAVPYFIDWNGYRGVFEEEATRILGREVRVGGNVNVRLLPAPFVRFDKLRIAGKTGQPFFSADSFTMRLSVPPLLKGILEANEIALTRPVLRLALDAGGSGNWSTLRITPGTLPFVPADVTLQSVKIDDGVVMLQGPKGTGVGEISGLDGELKADTITGPFAFRGTANWDGVPRELRFATDAADASGTIRFKATVRGTKLSNAYTIDGRLIDLQGRPRIEGDVTAKIELDAAPVSDAQQPNGVGDAAERPLLDFKAALTGDATGLRLDEMTLSFERVGQPQLITGTALASWSNDLRIELGLASRWLDLDRIAGSNIGAASPVETARSFVSAAMQALPKEAETILRFDLDQANLGGEAVSAIRLEVARNNGALLLKDLRAHMPGGAKLVLDGTVADLSDARNFQGELALRGTSLARFLTWAARDPAVTDAVRSDGPFSLQGRFGLSDQSFDLTDAGAEIGGAPFTGEVHYSSGERTRLAVALEGQEIDGAQLWPVGIGYLKGLLAGSPAPAADGKAREPKPQRRWLDTATSDLSLRLRASRLRTGSQPLRDVDMDIAVEQGRLSLRACKFATSDGLALELEGDVVDVSGEPRGELRGVVATPTKDSFATLVSLLDLPRDAAEQAQRYAALVPMRLAGAIRFAERGKHASDILIDGSLQGGRVVATARLDGGMENWRSGGADLELIIDSPDVVRTLDSLAARPSRSAAAPQERPGEIFFRAKGTPTNGLLATASVKASGLFLAYDGHIALPAEGDNKIDGEVRVSSSELGDVMAIAGLGSGGALRAIPIIGRLTVASADHAVELKPRQLKVGDSKVEGSLALAYPTEGPAIVTAQLQVDQASIPALLGVVLDRRVVAEVQGEPATEGKSIWPEHAFDFAALDGLEGKLGVDFNSLTLAPGMAMRNARMEVTLAPGKLAVTKLEASALGGNVFAALALERAPGGANLAGDIRLASARLGGTPKAGAAPQEDAMATMSLEFSGRGTTPGGLIAVATGKGEITLGDATMRVPTPLAVVATSEAVLSGEAGGSGEQLLAALRAQIASSPVKVGPRKIAIEIADGAAKLSKFTLPSPAGQTEVETTVDLASMVVDSAWLLEPKAPDVVQPDRPRKGALPTVSVVYVGPLKDVWSLEPRITADQLERELTIRRMELDAEQLERLHRLDAERARKEEERRRALDAEEQARAAAAEQDSAPASSAGEAPLAPWQVQPDPIAREPLPDISGSPPVPPIPGLEAQVAPEQPLDPLAVGGATPEAVPGAEAEAPQSTYRPQRAVRRKVPAGEQVLRSLQNNTN